ncbi:MAG: hypothetical protein N2690_01805, partial [Rhodocyclaceae bacterium]|nr:hypothetical protein [Rhodocyclaceae bacterium]
MHDELARPQFAPERLWPTAWRDHVRKHGFAAAGLIFATLAVLALLVQSALQALAGETTLALRYALAGGAAGFAATAAGALPALFLRSLPQRLEDSLLGFAAGMMLAASAFSLLLPGLAAGEEMLGHKGLAAGVVVLGMALGVLLMLGLDTFTPHEHDKSGPCGPAHARCGRVWLFVFAIALRGGGGGMAIGVA